MPQTSLKPSHDRTTKPKTFLSIFTVTFADWISLSQRLSESDLVFYLNQMRWDYIEALDDPLSLILIILSHFDSNLSKCNTMTFMTE